MSAPSDPLRILCKQNLAVEVLRNTGTVRVAALGYSMLPTLWPGEILTVETRSLGEIQRGDVVLFAREGRFFIHRCLGQVKTSSQAQLITRGDAMPDRDSPVSPDELLGKVTSVERRSGEVPVPACTLLRRGTGLLLAYSSRMRSLALRCNARRRREVHSELPETEPDQVLVR